MLTRSIHDRFVTPANALWSWRVMLFEGSGSHLYSPGFSLDWLDLTTLEFRDWWPKVSINDLRDKADILCLNIGNEPARVAKGRQRNDAKGAN